MLLYNYSRLTKGSSSDLFKFGKIKAPDFGKPHPSQWFLNNFVEKLGIHFLLNEK